MKTAGEHEMNEFDLRGVQECNLFLPCFSCAVTIVTGHQTKRTLSPGTCAPAMYNIQLGTQYSGVPREASSAQSHAGTLGFALHLDHLTTNKRWE